MMEAIAVTAAPLRLDDLLPLVAGAGGFGAIACFVGIVRRTNQGRVVTHLEYEAYEPMAARMLDRIRSEAAGAWPGAALAVHHRIGRLAIGEASVAIAAASPHRADAFAVCRYTIERVKQIVPIWKHEFFEGGEVWVEGATADPDDDAARAEAMRRACG